MLQGSITKTKTAWIGKDLYGAPVWLVVTQEVDGKERPVFHIGSNWASIPVSRRAEAETLHAETVARFGDCPEDPTKPLGRRERAEKFGAIEDKLHEEFRRR